MSRQAFGMAGFLLSGTVKFLTRGLPVHPSNIETKNGGDDL